MQNAEQTPIVASFALDNAAILRTLWPLLPQQIKDDLEASGITSIATVADINGGLDWRVWTGKVAVRSYWRAFGEFIAVADDQGVYEINPQVIQDMAKYLMARDPHIGGMVVQVNLGREVIILPPINLPAPPLPEPPVEETPVDSLESPATNQ